MFDQKVWVPRRGAYQSEDGQIGGTIGSIPPLDPVAFRRLDALNLLTAVRLSPRYRTRHNEVTVVTTGFQAPNRG